jgi:hypothetical protein
MDLAMIKAQAFYSVIRKKSQREPLKEPGLNSLRRKWFNQQIVRLFMPENKKSSKLLSKQSLMR